MKQIFILLTMLTVSLSAQAQGFVTVINDDDCSHEIYYDDSCVTIAGHEAKTFQVQYFFKDACGHIVLNTRRPSDDSAYSLVYAYCQNGFSFIAQANNETKLIEILKRYKEKYCWQSAYGNHIKQIVYESVIG